MSEVATRIRGIEEQIRKGDSLASILPSPHEYAALGGEKDVLIAPLAARRRDLSDEASEDRLLEVLDVLHGFVSPPMKIW